MLGLMKKESPLLTFEYTNWEGKTAVRKVKPKVPVYNLVDAR